MCCSSRHGLERSGADGIDIDQVYEVLRRSLGGNRQDAESQRRRPDCGGVQIPKSQSWTLSQERIVEGRKWSRGAE